MLGTYNEWDQLREIVVGIADHANWPTDDPVFAKESEKTTWKETPVPSGPVPDWIIKEANEDLNELTAVLQGLGVIVHRPTQQNFQELGGMYNYCPRDRLLVWGHTVVDCPMMYPCRDIEINSLQYVVGQASKILKVPQAHDAIFDAANICRLGNKWLYLESPSGNRRGYEVLQQQFPTVEIELCNFYSGVHIDSTIVPIREGLALINGARVNPDQLPKALAGWDCRFIYDVVEQSFYQYPYASKWIGLNLLMVNPNLAIVDKKQIGLITLLNSLDVETIPLELRHSRTLGGGFHCVTLDLARG